MSAISTYVPRIGPHTVLPAAEEADRYTDNDDPFNSVEMLAEIFFLYSRLIVLHIHVSISDRSAAE